MKRLALIGMPNAEKFALFNHMSGASAKVANWPGLTVDLLTAKLLLAGDMTELLDLPGIYDLHEFSDDEHVVRHFLMSIACAQGSKVAASCFTTYAISSQCYTPAKILIASYIRTFNSCF